MRRTRETSEPSTSVFIDGTLDSALVHWSYALGLEWLSILTGLEHAGRVHCALERVTLPAEEVICVGTVALVVTHAQEERIRAILGPHGVELSCIPQSLIGYLWHTNWVRGWARTRGLEGSLYSVKHVRLVVRAVQILAIPACREVVNSHNATFTWLVGEIRKLGESRPLSFQANEAQTIMFALIVTGRAANGHSEAWLKRGHLLVAVGTERLLRIVDGHSAIDAVGQCCILHDRYTLVRAVRMLEEHHGGPVVGEVLSKGACRASTSFTDIAVHGCVEGISTDNLVEMCRWDFARLNDWIESLDAQS